MCLIGTGIPSLPLSTVIGFGRVFCESIHMRCCVVPRIMCCVLLYLLEAY